MADGLKISTLVLVLLRVSIEAVHVYYDCVWHKLLCSTKNPQNTTVGWLVVRESQGRGAGTQLVALISDGNMFLAGLSNCEQSGCASPSM